MDKNTQEKMVGWLTAETMEKTENHRKNRRICFD